MIDREIHKILIPVDDSKMSDRAFDYGMDMAKLFDAEVAKEVTKAKAEFLKGTTPTTGTSTKNTEKDTYNKAKKAGDVRGMLDAKFYATEETD